MGRLRLRMAPDRLSLSGLGGWLLFAVLAADVLRAAPGASVPSGSGFPFWAACVIGTVTALAIATLLAARLRPSDPWLRPLEAFAILAVVTMVMTDFTIAWQPFRDTLIYLKAGEHFREGSPVYMQVQMTVVPEDRSNYPFLYPPFTLPLFAALSLLPRAAAEALWLVGSVVLGLTALRLFGLPRRWAIGALLWPPLFQGLWVGNVAVPALALFAAGPWLGAGLILGAAFKSYTGLAAIWLVPERRWRAIATGVAALLLIAVATLPLTGLALWSDWLKSLGIYQASQPGLPTLYGFGLPAYLPFALYGLLSAAAIVMALRVRGRESLARLGAATVVASPSLFGHGLLIAVPSILSLRSPWLWLAIGFLSTPAGLQWWGAIAVVVASWFVPAMRRTVGRAEPLHPLEADRQVWPELSGEGRSGRSGHRQVVDAGLAIREGIPERIPDGLDSDSPIA